jgi:hypothetical protein
MEHSAIARVASIAGTDPHMPGKGLIFPLKEQDIARRPRVRAILVDHKRMAFEERKQIRATPVVDIPVRILVGPR